MFSGKNNILVIFLLLSVLVALSNVFILQPFLKYQLIELFDDWYWMTFYRSLSHMDFVPRVIYIWKQIGVHESGYALFVGFLGELFGLNYDYYNYALLVLKVFATITLFPLIYLLFKDIKLSFLSTFLYGITSASTGSLYWMMKGGSYLATGLMNLFFCFYYLSVVKKSKLMLFVAAAFMLISYLVSAVRVYPAFVIIVLAELYISFGVNVADGLKRIIKKPSLLLPSAVRLVLFILPSFLAASTAPLSPHGFVEEKPIIITRDILNGNWHDVLTPIAGLGYSFFTNHYWPFFGQITPDTFSGLFAYFKFLFAKPLLIFAVSTLIISVSISKEWKRFFVKVMLMSSVAFTLMFFIATRHFFVPKEFWFEYDPTLFYLTKYPTLMGIYVLTVALFAFLEWRKRREDRILMAVWVGPLFSLIFLAAMWVAIGYLLNGYSSTGYYFQIPAIGMSLLMGSLLIKFYNMLGYRFVSKLFATGIIALIVGLVFVTSGLEIKKSFTSDNPGMISVSQQKELHRNMFSQLGSAAQDGDLLLFIELPEEEKEKAYYHLAFLGFHNSVIWNRKGSGGGCVGTFNSKEELKLSFQPERSEFVATGLCYFPGKKIGRDSYGVDRNVHFDLKNFYAFSFDKNYPIDITKKVLDDLIGMKEN